MIKMKLRVCLILILSPLIYFPPPVKSHTGKTSGVPYAVDTGYQQQLIEITYNGKTYLVHPSKLIPKTQNGAGANGTPPTPTNGAPGTVTPQQPQVIPGQKSYPGGVQPGRIGWIWVPKSQIPPGSGIQPGSGIHPGKTSGWGGVYPGVQPGSGVHPGKTSGWGGVYPGVGGVTPGVQPGQVIQPGSGIHPGKTSGWGGVYPGLQPGGVVPGGQGTSQVVCFHGTTNGQQTPPWPSIPTKPQHVPQQPQYPSQYPQFPQQPSQFPQKSSNYPQFSQFPQQPPPQPQQPQQPPQIPQQPSQFPPKSSKYPQFPQFPQQPQQPQYPPQYPQQKHQQGQLIWSQQPSWPSTGGKSPGQVQPPGQTYPGNGGINYPQYPPSQKVKY